MIGGLLLAAGSARRFGGDKLLACLPDDTPIAVAAASTLVAVLPRVVAVVRPGADELGAALRECGTQVLVCPRAGEGMGTSLAWGVTATPDWTGWLVALADMPFVKAATVTALAAAVADGAAIAAPRYQGRRGHPYVSARAIARRWPTWPAIAGAATFWTRRAIVFTFSTATTLAC